MGDSRLLNKIDSYIQEHLLQISDQEEFLKLPRLKVSACMHTSSFHFEIKMELSYAHKSYFSF